MWFIATTLTAHASTISAQRIAVRVFGMGGIYGKKAWYTHSFIIKAVKMLLHALLDNKIVDYDAVFADR